MKRIKKIIGLIAFAALTFSIAAVGGGAKTANAAPPPASGRLTLGFSDSTDLDRFDFYSETRESAPFFVRDGKLYGTGRGEQKAILKDYSNLSSYELSAEISPLYPKGPLDMGFYIHATNPGNNCDQIRSFTVNLERGDGDKYLWVKIQRFTSAWGGVVSEVRIPYVSDNVRVRAVVQNASLKVYMYGMDTPAIDTTIGSTSGAVGIRVFRGVGGCVDNFTLKAAAVPVYYRALQDAVLSAGDITADGYTPSSYGVFVAALSAANSALSGADQSVIDYAEAALSDAVKNLTVAYSYGALDGLVEQAKSFTPADYTANTYNSMMLSVARAELLSTSSNENVISKEAKILERCIASLAAYKV
jgi:hypothetical protein